jgi:hypothetical protein
MAVEWTTHTIVLTYLRGVSIGSLTQAEIESFIEQAEGYYKGRLKIPSTFTFNAAKKQHLILRHLVNLDVALTMIGSVLQSFNTLAEAGKAADILIDKYKQVYGDLIKDHILLDAIQEA